MTRRTDRPSLMVRVVPGPRLEPITAHDAEVLDVYAVGTELSIEPKHAKNNKFVAKYWAILSRVVEATDWASTKALSKALLIEAGLVNEIVMIGGGVDKEPMSITDLDQEEFERYYHEALALICRHILPHMTPEELENWR